MKERLINFEPHKKSRPTNNQCFFISKNIIMNLNFHIFASCSFKPFITYKIN